MGVDTQGEPIAMRCQCFIRKPTLLQPAQDLTSCMRHSEGRNFHGSLSRRLLDSCFNCQFNCALTKFRSYLVLSLNGFPYDYFCVMSELVFSNHLSVFNWDMVGLDASLHSVMMLPWLQHTLDFLILLSLIHVPLVIGMVLALVMFLATKYSDQIVPNRTVCCAMELHPANRLDSEGLTICPLMEGIQINKVPAGLLPPGSGSYHKLRFRSFAQNPCSYVCLSMPRFPTKDICNQMFRAMGQCKVSILPYTFKSSCNWLMDLKGRIYGQPIPPFWLSSFRHLQVDLRSFEDRPPLSSVELHKPRPMHRTLLSFDSNVPGEECIIQGIGLIYGCEDYWFISLFLYYAVIRAGQAVSLIRLTSVIFEVFYQHLSRLSSLLIRSLINGGEKHDHILEAVTFQQLCENNFFLHEAESNDTGLAVSGVMVWLRREAAETRKFPRLPEKSFLLHEALQCFPVPEPRV
ncbi:hypothetical protein VNO77_18966 [Canavalia gladiata]|uniref:Uncharacterized protein n=1 Tax=Canavalia gladiata TaxID=3824 RepID=A0AAN9QK39_CANGL